MPTVVQFAYGPANPVAGFLLAFVGALIGLGAAAQARPAVAPARPGSADNGRRVRWLLVAALALGVGIWLMHFTAMLGFEVVGNPVHYDVLATLCSAAVVLVGVAVGVFVAAYGRRSAPRVIAGGVLTGLGVAGMHYTGMAAIRMSGTISYDHPLLYASVAGAGLASVLALWFLVAVRRFGSRVIAAVVTAGAMTAVHYTGMAAVRVHLRDELPPANGVNPIALVLPITIIAAALLMTLIFTALAAMSEEGRTPIPPPARHGSALMLADEPFRALPARTEGRPLTINGFATHPKPERLPRSRRL